MATTHPLQRLRFRHQVSLYKTLPTHSFSDIRASFCRLNTTKISEKQLTLRLLSKRNNIRLSRIATDEPVIRDATAVNDNVIYNFDHIITFYPTKRK